MAGLWPSVITLRHPEGSSVVLRALRTRDRDEWEMLRAVNENWLRPWEATSPVPPQARSRFRQLVRHYDREGREGRMQPFVIEVDGRLAGQMHLFGIGWGRAAWGSGRLLGRPASRRPRHRAARARRTRRPRDLRPRAAPRRGQHPPGERREPARRRQARLPRRGHPRGLSAHRRSLARPSHVRPHGRGSRRHLARQAVAPRTAPRRARHTRPVGRMSWADVRLRGPEPRRVTSV